MKFQIKSAIYTGVLGIGLVGLTVAFQNCSRMGVAIDDSKKASVLSASPVFSGSSPGQTEPGTNNGAGPGQNEPGGSNGGNPPGQNEPGGNNSGNPPGQGEPGNNAGLPPGANEPGGNNSGTPPGATEPGGNAGLPPGAPEGGNTSSGLPPGANESASSITFTRSCPLAGVLHGASKTVLQVSGEIKLVIATMSSSGSVCSIDNVKAQVLAGTAIDITSCNLTKNGFYQVFLVEESVTSNYAQNKLNEDPTMFMPGSINFNFAVITNMNDTKNLSYCDRTGDPLVIQLNTSTPQPISLTSAQNGVMFDLLGERNSHVAVKTAWFASKSENYFLVLPDASGAVNGIDELFGDATMGPDKKYAKQGFAALAKYDINKDHMITVEDDVYGKLRLWKDDNLDGVVQANELYTLDQKGVVAIDLRYDRRFKETDQYGNMTKYKSVVLMKDNSYGLIYDLWLRYISK